MNDQVIQKKGRQKTAVSTLRKRSIFCAEKVQWGRVTFAVTVEHYTFFFSQNQALEQDS